VTLNIDLALGLRYSYYLGSSDVWTVSDNDNTEYEDRLLNISYSGGAVMLQLIYSPKALGFDPMSALGNLTE